MILTGLHWLSTPFKLLANPMGFCPLVASALMTIYSAQHFIPTTTTTTHTKHKLDHQIGRAKALSLPQAVALLSLLCAFSRLSIHNLITHISIRLPTNQADRTTRSVQHSSRPSTENRMPAFEAQLQSEIDQVLSALVDDPTAAQVG